MEGRRNRAAQKEQQTALGRIYKVLLYDACVCFFTAALVQPVPMPRRLSATAASVAGADVGAEGVRHGQRGTPQKPQTHSLTRETQTMTVMTRLVSIEVAAGYSAEWALEEARTLDPKPRATRSLLRAQMCEARTKAAAEVEGMKAGAVADAVADFAVAGNGGGQDVAGHPQRLLVAAG